MDHKELLVQVCYTENKSLKEKSECRSLLINQFILEDGMGVDEAENLSDKLLNESGFWPIPQFDFDIEETNTTTK